MKTVRSSSSCSTRKGRRADLTAPAAAGRTWQAASTVAPRQGRAVGLSAADGAIREASGGGMLRTLWHRLGGARALLLAAGAVVVVLILAAWAIGQTSQPLFKLYLLFPLLGGLVGLARPRRAPLLAPTRSTLVYVLACLALVAWGLSGLWNVLVTATPAAGTAFPSPRDLGYFAGGLLWAAAIWILYEGVTPDFLSEIEANAFLLSWMAIATIFVLSVAGGADLLEAIKAGGNTALLEHLSKPFLEGVEADEGTAQGKEGEMNIRPSLVAHAQSAVLAQPGQRALHHPAMAAQPFAGVDPLAGDADPDVPPPAGGATARDVVGLVGVQFVRPFAPPPIRLFDRGHGIQHRFEHHRLMAIGAGQQLGQREAAAIGQNVPFGAGFGTIDRVGTDEIAPFLAGMLAQSKQARLQSIWPAAPSRSSRVRCNASHTPACCQSRSLRQQVTPEPQPISWGSSSQGMPARRTEMMPVSAARSGTRGRPPWGLGGSGGSSGATTAHNSSLTKGFMPQVYHASPRF